MDVYNQLDLHIREGHRGLQERTRQMLRAKGYAPFTSQVRAAEARVRVHSDVNLVVVVEEFAEHQAKDLREALPDGGARR